MNAIIIAAGRGKRLEHFTDNRPKCLVDIAGQSILDRQIASYRAVGVDRICVIRGYRAELLQRDGLEYRLNAGWADNNILLSLSHAHDFLQGDVLVSYSDLVMTPESLRPLVDNAMASPFLLQVDTAFADYYDGRSEHPIEEAESVIYDPETLVIGEVGKKIPHKELTMGEFTGVWRLNDEGCRLWRDGFRRAREKHAGKPFGYAPVFEKAYLTDLMMMLIAEGCVFAAAPGVQQVMEIDTTQDKARVEKMLAQPPQREPIPPRCKW